MKRCIPLLLVAACATEKPNGAGTEFPAWRLEPIANFTPPADTGWTRAKAVIADRDGNVYVLDEGASQIRVFDSTGASIRVIGRKGAGPAEFALAYGMGLGWLGDTLAVLDPGNGRLTRLTKEGNWIGSWPTQHFTGPAARLHLPTLHSVYARASRPDSAAQSILVGFTNAGPRDTIEQPVTTGDPPADIMCGIDHGGIWFTHVPFVVMTIWTAGPNGELVAARTGTYSIEFIGPDDDTLRTVRRTLDPVPVSDSEWAAGTEEYRTFRQKNPGAECKPSEPSRAGVKPVLRNLVFDDAGNLWVERVTLTGFALDVFDPSGQPLGTMAAPAHDDYIPVYVRGDRLYVIATDDASGLQSVRSYRIVRDSHG